LTELVEVGAWMERREGKRQREQLVLWLRLLTEMV
jgi:hypothetical protein